jgi:hypothetical protein
MDLGGVDAGAESVIARTAVLTAGPFAIAVPSPPEAAGVSGPERWFPLGRYDLYVLVPVLIGQYLYVLLATAEKKIVGFQVSMWVTVLYSIVIAVQTRG